MGPLGWGWGGGVMVRVRRGGDWEEGGCEGRTCGGTGSIGGLTFSGEALDAMRLGDG